MQDVIEAGQSSGELTHRTSCTVPLPVSWRVNQEKHIMDLPGMLASVRRIRTTNMYQLVFQPNTRSSLCVDFDGQVLTVGRRDDNDIVIDDPSVSACHARFSMEDEGGLFVVDLGSSNGTWLNGRQVVRQRLVSGDVLSIARRVEVLVLEDDEIEGFVRPDPEVLKELAESVRSLFVKKDAET